MMPVKLAYLGVVLIWTTTPLAIQWSHSEISFILSLSARMSIGLVFLIWLLMLKGQRLPWHKRAIASYFAASLQLLVSMAITYWASQWIPSGWMSVIFGLTPFFTAILAMVWLNEQSLSPLKLSAYGLGLLGLSVMFKSAVDLNQHAIWGVSAILFAALIQCISSIWVKKLNASITALELLTGGLLVSMPGYWLSWYWLDGSLPETVSVTSLWCIVYLGMIATIFGFSWYFFVLSRLAATQVAMINLLTPVLSLWLGNTVNNEAITFSVISGTALIVLALALYQYSEKTQKTVFKKT